eukprot:scaffold754_cov248-Pinguiococcus_pyrenoidosus.AAC.48
MKIAYHTEFFLGQRRFSVDRPDFSWCGWPSRTNFRFQVDANPGKVRGVQVKRGARTSAVRDHHWSPGVSRGAPQGVTAQ